MNANLLKFSIQSILSARDSKIKLLFLKFKIYPYVYLCPKKHEMGFHAEYFKFANKIFDIILKVSPFVEMHNLFTKVHQKALSGQKRLRYSFLIYKKI